MRSKRLVVIISFAIAVGASMASGVPFLNSVTPLTPMTGDAVMSKIYAISPDGSYAVGSSNGTNIAGTATLSQGIIWSASDSSTTQVPNDPNINGQAGLVDQPNHAHGVAFDSTGRLHVAAYFYNPSTNNYRMANYIVPQGAGLTSGGWLIHRQRGPVVAEYNAARTFNNADVVVAGQRASRSSAIAAIMQGEPGYPTETSNLYTEYRTADVVGTTPPGPFMLTAASRVLYGSSYVFGVGWDTGNPNGKHRAFAGATPNGVNSTPLPDSGYESETLGLTPDATISTGLAVGFDRDTTDDHFAHAAVWDLDTRALSTLAELGGDTQSVAIDVRLINGNPLIGGYSSDGTTETAVVWDSTGIWGTGGEPVSLMAALAAAGVDVSGWSSLSRATTMTDDGTTVAGWGIWADGSTRGFIASIPEPATLLLSLLGLSLLRRRR